MSSTKIYGTVTHAAHHGPIPGLIIQAYDKDLKGKKGGELLGSAQTGADGKYAIDFERSFWTSLFDRKPDIYLEARDANGNLLHTTENAVRWNTQGDQEFNFKLKLNSDSGGTGNSAKIEIKNTLAGGDYAGKIEIGTGSDAKSAWVILDSGSSTLAIWNDFFADSSPGATDYVQVNNYGSGSWGGPVVSAPVSMGTAPHTVSLSALKLGMIEAGQVINASTGAVVPGGEIFQPANGILGLAFSALNNAYDAGQATYPVSKYPISNYYDASSSKHPGPNLSQNTLTPFFAQISAPGGAQPKMGFLTKRSTVYAGPGSSNPDAAWQNGGYFVMGGGEEHTELYTGSFKAALEIPNAQGQGVWYNTKFLSLRVGSQDKILVPSLTDIANYYHLQPLTGMVSNSIIDTGTNSIPLNGSVFSQMMDSFKSIDASYYNTILDALQKGPRSLSASDVASWPSIFIELQGEGSSTIELEMKPDTYWQVDAYTNGETHFMISPSYVNAPGGKSETRRPFSAFH